MTGQEILKAYYEEQGIAILEKREAKPLEIFLQEAINIIKQEAWECAYSKCENDMNDRIDKAYNRGVTDGAKHGYQ